MPKNDPKRGEIWRLHIGIAVGQEIRKDRPVIVMNVPNAGRKEMRLIVPITTGNEKYANLFWMTRIQADSANGLQHDSYADASQIQSASVKRFSQQLGVIQSQRVLEKIAASIGLSVGHPPRKSSKSRRKRK